jgi:hypothetical protein
MNMLVGLANLYLLRRRLMAAWRAKFLPHDSEWRMKQKEGNSARKYSREINCRSVRAKKIGCSLLKSENRYFSAPPSNKRMQGY